jgi:hypothetical protein
MRKRLLLMVPAIAFLATSGALGWVTAPGAGDATARAAPAASTPGTQLARKATRRPPPRILRLRALDTVLDVDQIEHLSAPELASFGAKKWTDMLGSEAQAIARGPGPVLGLEEYFEGWQAVTAAASPYSTAQFTASLHTELCRRSPEERALLQTTAPALAEAATGPCPP